MHAILYLREGKEIDNINSVPFCALKTLKQAFLT